MSNSPPNINELLHGVYPAGELSTQGLQTLTVNADIGTQIEAGLGIAPDGGHTDLHQNVREIGILHEWILTPANTANEIRSAFQVFSQSAVRVSQGAMTMSIVRPGLGGFTN